MQNLFTILFLFLFTASAFAQTVLLNVPLPITGKIAHNVEQTLERIRKEREGKADKNEELAVIFQFTVGEQQEVFGRGSSFGACYELASQLSSGKLNGIKSIAYFPKKADVAGPQRYKGHVLLVALACDEWAAAEGVELGEAAVDEPTLTDTQRNAYHEIVQKRRRVPLAVVDKMLDAAVNLQQVETEQGTRFGTPAELAELEKQETFADEPADLIPSGQPGLFTADTARKVGLLNLIADDKTALARALGYRPDDIKYAPVAGEHGHAVRVDLTGKITSDSAGAVLRTLQTISSDSEGENPAGQSQTDFICLYIDSPGGSLDASLNLASFIVQDIDPSRIKTVAYIPFQARSDAAIVALACDEIVLGNGAVLGGDGAAVFTAEQISDAKRTLQDFLAKEALRSWSLPAAFIDSDIEVFEAARMQNGRELKDYFCEDELKEQPDADLWRRGEIVKPKGKLLEITNSPDAPRHFFVDRTANDFTEFKSLYGLENDVEFLEPGWADQLLRSLSSPKTSFWLLVFFFLGLVIELHSPGLNVGTFVALVSITLFFWLNYLGGTADVLEILLFVIGCGCILLEIFVLPGVGIFGIGGAIAVICSLVLASQTFIIPQNSYQLAQFQNSIQVLLMTLLGMFVSGLALMKILRRANKPKDTELIQQWEKLADYDALLGQSGVTLTPLVPAGKAVFSGKPVDVVSDGELIEKGAAVEVVEVVGYKIVVRKCDTIKR